MESERLCPHALAKNVSALQSGWMWHSFDSEIGKQVEQPSLLQKGRFKLRLGLLSVCSSGIKRLETNQAVINVSAYGFEQILEVDS